jgi:hypothetical protein
MSRAHILIACWTATLLTAVFALGIGGRAIGLYALLLGIGLSAGVLIIDQSIREEKP